MRIARSMYDEIVAHAQAEAPNECCGVVSTDDGVAIRVYRMTNAEASPFRFEMEGRELYRVHTEIEDAGLVLGAIYHSHTRSEPYPSLTDLRFSEGWPGAIWIIVGLAASEPEVRAYEIRDGRVIEARLEVV